jgi:hypothetical protein
MVNQKTLALSIMLIAVAAISIGTITSTSANAKESSCDVSAGGKCLIIAKRGDIEIDKLTIVVGSGGGGVATNLTDINNAISVLQGQVASQGGQLGSVTNELNTLAGQVANFSDTGITSIEITPVNETGPVVNETTPVPPVTNETGTGGNDTTPIPEPIPPVTNETGNTTGPVEDNSTGTETNSTG